MLLFIQGADSYLAKQAIDQVKAKYLAKNDSAELIEIDAGETLPNFADLQAVPLFATSRLAIIRRVGLLDATAQESLAHTLTNLPPTTVAVVWDQKPLKVGSVLQQVLAAASKTISAEPLSPPALRRWLVAKAKELDIALDEAALGALLSSGGDLWFLETELRYLATTVGQPTETHQKVQKSDEPFIYFRLTRSRDYKKIGRQLAQDFRTGTPFELLLGTLAAAVRKEVTDKTEKRRLVELMSDIDFGTKTGLLEPGEAIALLSYHLPNSSVDRVHWEAMWEGIA